MKNVTLSFSIRMCRGKISDFEAEATPKRFRYEDAYDNIRSDDRSERGRLSMLLTAYTGSIVVELSEQAQVMQRCK